MGKRGKEKRKRNKKGKERRRKKNGKQIRREKKEKEIILNSNSRFRKRLDIDKILIYIKTSKWWKDRQEG